MLNFRRDNALERYILSLITIYLTSADTECRMLAFCGHKWWRKSENPGKNTDLGRATDTFMICSKKKDCTNWMNARAKLFVALSNVQVSYI